MRQSRHYTRFTQYTHYTCSMKRISNIQKKSLVKRINNGASARELSKKYHVALSSIYNCMKEYAPLRSELNDAPA